jgi:hypothetical protein
MTAAVAAVLLALPSGRLTAQVDGVLSGVWTLDRDISQFPREIGFEADFVPPARGDSADSDGRRARRGAGIAPLLRPQGESYEDGQRRQQLTDEVRNPPSRLTIVDTPDLVTFSDDKGNSRRLHPDGRTETLTIANVPVLTMARRDGTKLVVLYAIADLRQIRYTYTRLEGTASIAVDVEFIERSRPGDTVKRVYNRATPLAPGTAATAAAGGSPAAGPDTGAAPKPVVPRAGSEFAGLKRLGLVVEDLAQQATACGLTREALEAAASRPFTAAGIRVSTNSDEDTYVHITVMTSSLPNGMCISRYDWSIYSTTEATLSYQSTPLLAQVLLAHKGGLSGSMPNAHAADVIRSLTDGFAQIAGMIRDANR